MTIIDHTTFIPLLLAQFYIHRPIYVYVYTQQVSIVYMSCHGRHHHQALDTNPEPCYST